MNLSKEELKELNSLLKTKSLDLPSMRRVVTSSGNNYRWLQRNLMIRNPKPNPRLCELLKIKTPTIA